MTLSEIALSCFGERARGQHEPGVFLGRGGGAQRARAIDAQHRIVDGLLRRPAFGGERHQRRRITQGRAEIGAAEIELRLRRYGVERREIDIVGARLVADHRQRRRDLRFCNRRRDVGKLDVGDVTQVTDRRGAVARQHVERIGQLAAAVFAGLGSGGDVVAQTVDRERVRRRRHLESALARPRQEIGDIGIEPGILAADRPQAERAIRALPRQQPRNGIFDALVDLAIRG